MKIHKPERSGRIGGVDSWGYGSSATVWDYPTLGLRGVVVVTTTGGVRYPTIQGVSPVFGDRPEYAPDQYWGQYAPIYTLPDGRLIRPVIRDGENCFEEDHPILS